jgi:antitoxin VapB
MAISIKDPDTDRLARALAEATGESITEAIRRAIEERLEREGHRPHHQFLADGIRRIQERVAALPVLDSRSADEILGYDSNGLPV